jgi:CopG family transcriptional regulator / antitoxin EndoAI
LNRPRNPGDSGEPWVLWSRTLDPLWRPGKTSCYRRLMRTTGTVTISLPPELAVEVDRLAHEEGRTRSELLREAFRQYAERRRRWDQLFAYGEERAAAGALTEDTVVAAVKSRRSRSRRKPPR